MQWHGQVLTHVTTSPDLLSWNMIIAILCMLMMGEGRGGVFDASERRGCSIFDQLQLAMDYKLMTKKIKIVWYIRIHNNHYIKEIMKNPKKFKKTCKCACQKNKSATINTFKSIQEKTCKCASKNRSKTKCKVKYNKIT